MMTPEEFQELIKKTKTKLEQRLQEERSSDSDECSVADGRKETDAVVEEDGTLTDSNPTLPVILKENAILAGLNNQQYLTYAKKQVVEFFDREDWNWGIVSL